MAITDSSSPTHQGQVQEHTNSTDQAVHVPAQPTPSSASTGQPMVSVVIPTLNEARNLEHVFAALPAGLHEVIIVDGHSVDGTPEVARRLRPDVRVISQTRTGKGNALACGFAAATGEIIVMSAEDNIVKGASGQAVQSMNILCGFPETSGLI